MVVEEPQPQGFDLIPLREDSCFKKRGEEWNTIELECNNVFTHPTGQHEPTGQKLRLSTLRQTCCDTDTMASPPSPNKPMADMPSSFHVAAWQADGPCVVEETSWRAEVKMIILLAVPSIVQGAAQQAMLITDQLFVGHLGTNALAAAALGTTYSNLMWFFLLGSSTALDTLGAQAFGARNRTALVRVTLTSMIVQSVFCFILSVALCFGETVAVHLFGQDGEVAALVGEYCYGLIPGMWPLVLGITLMKYLQTQNIMMVPALITVAAFLLNIGFNAALISVLGFKGAPLATSISRFCQFIFIIIAIYRHELQQQREQALAPDADMVVEINSVPLLSKGSGLDGATGEKDRMDGAAKNTPLEEASSQILLLLLPWQRGSHQALPSDLERPSASSDGSGPGKGPPGLTMKRLSWFRSPSWCVTGRESEADEAVRSVTQCPGPLRYWTSQLKASVHPQLLGRYLKLALPGGFMLAFEAAAFDVTTAMAGHLSSVTTAAHAALLGIVYFTYAALPLAVSTAATIRVGNLLGAGKPQLARMSGYLSIVMSASGMVLVAILILTCRNVLGRAFSSDPEFIATVAQIAPFAALFQVSDGILGPAQGILRGCGRQLQIMFINILGWWVLGVFLGYMLTFYAGLGVYGLWIGIASGDFAAASLNMTSLYFLDWKKEAQTAAAVVKGLQQPGDERPAVHDSAMMAGDRDDITQQEVDATIVINKC